MAAARSPPAFDPAKRKFLRPRTTRNTRSAAALSFQLTVVNVSREHGPAREVIADRCRRIGLPGELGKQRICSGLTDGLAASVALPRISASMAYSAAMRSMASAW